MRLVNYHNGEGWRVAIADEPGRKYINLVMFDPTEMHVTNVPIEESKYMRDIVVRPRIKLTPLASTAKRWMAAASATKGAREILVKAAAQ